ncbi:ferrous iron transport protein A [Oscillochloris sp. ZM17-4]|uniref:FeoA family protein n=1 Tax=Oscillochloris sp. ZM17-4 TaxID=2866714 RepID=UPI001C73D998|nr:FeoA family protein [Oscillochloris sp. ZM17-4]MBX0328465.1 ferrous iron transport protein A [Oscillochloris sp. ZM17-4]
MTVAPIPLSDLPVGQSATIVTLGVVGALRRRLLALGLLPGERLTVARVAPMGDPLEIELKGYRLSLRKADAREIMVSRRS